MNTPQIVSAKDWTAAHQRMLVEEKEFTRARDALAAKRRRMPWTEVDETYHFDGPDGRVTLLDLFQGRRQLIVYRAFVEPGVPGWPEHGCVGCSLMADHVGNLAHLNARDTTLVYASRGSQDDLERIKARMGWEIPWYTIVPGAARAFDVDFGVDEWHGTNAFIRDGDRVFRTYFIDNRGDEAFVNTWAFLDVTALGRQETWDDSPEGYPQSPPYEWWSWHDAYAAHKPSRWFGEPDPDDPNDPGHPARRRGVIPVAPADAIHVARVYQETRERVCSLMTGSGDAWAVQLAACPGWSVRDVLAHMTAVADDWAAGRLLIGGCLGQAGRADRSLRGPRRRVGDDRLGRCGCATGPHGRNRKRCAPAR